MGTSAPKMMVPKMYLLVSHHPLLQATTQYNIDPSAAGKTGALPRHNLVTQTARPSKRCSFSPEWKHGLISRQTASVQKSNTMDILRSACKGTTSRIFQKQMLHLENQSFFFVSPDFPSPHFNFHLIPNIPLGLVKVKEQRTVLSVTVSG